MRFTPSFVCVCLPFWVTDLSYSLKVQPDYHWRSKGSSVHNREEGGVKEEEVPGGVMTSSNAARVMWCLPWSCAKVYTQVVPGEMDSKDSTGLLWASSLQQAELLGRCQSPRALLVQVRQAKTDCVGVKPRWQGQGFQKTKEPIKIYCQFPGPLPLLVCGGVRV